MFQTVVTNERGNNLNIFYNYLWKTYYVLIYDLEIYNNFNFKTNFLLLFNIQ